MSILKAIPLGLKWTVGGVLFLLFVYPFLQPLTEKEEVTRRRERMQSVAQAVGKDVSSYVSHVSREANEWYAQNSTEAKQEALAKAETERQAQESAALAAIASQNAQAAERRAAVDLAILETMKDLRSELKGAREPAQVDVDVRVHNPLKTAENDR
jgi:hypothetical protein